MEVQLVFSTPRVSSYEEMVGKGVVATGTLYQHFTGRHCTAVLLKVSTIRKQDERNRR